VLQKSILDFASNIRKPIDLKPDVNRLIGHCRLSLIDDGKVCFRLTETFYDQDIGARSLEDAVRGVQQDFSGEYGNVDELIMEDINADLLQHFVVRRISVGADAYEIGVSANGIGGSVIEEKGYNKTLTEIGDKTSDHSLGFGGALDSNEGYY
jgi:hypothetical protein